MHIYILCTHPRISHGSYTMRAVLLLLLLVVATVALFIIGARGGGIHSATGISFPASCCSTLGPSVTVVEQFLFRACVQPGQYPVWDGRSVGEPLHKHNCDRIGTPLTVSSRAQLEAFPPAQVVYHVTIPTKVIKRKLSRWDHYLLADLDIVFYTDEYPKAVVGE